MYLTIKKKIKRITKSSKGFSAAEWVVCAVILGIIFVNLGKQMVSSLNNGKFVQKIADTEVLSTQKATELFNDSKNQAAKISEGQTRAGSISPNQPVDGYFDLFNDSACLLRNYAQSSSTGDSPTKDGTSSSGTTEGTLSRLDCSTSTFREPSQSLEPKFRRQWLVVKDFPNKNDVTYSVVVVYLEKNQVVRLTTLTKTDGAITK